MECAPEGEEGEEARLDRKLQALVLSGDGTAEDCECASPLSPASPELESGRFEGFAGLAGAEDKDEVRQNRRLQARAARPPRQRRESAPEGKEFDRFGIPSPEAIQGGSWISEEQPLLLLLFRRDRRPKLTSVSNHFRSQLPLSACSLVRVESR